MPQLVDIEGVGEVEFDDGLSPDQIKEAIERDILPRFQKAPPVQSSQPSLSASEDMVRRVPAEIARGTMNTLAGGMRALGLASQGLGDLLGVQMDNPYEQQAESLAGTGQEFYNFYGTDPAQDQALRSKVASGIGSVVPAIASGPLSPITAGLQVGEGSYQQAVQEGANPEDAALNFAANTLVGSVTERLLGVVPNLPSLIKGVPARTFTERAVRTAEGLLKGSGREASQEALEQVASNIIARETYDPNQDLFEGVAESALVGGIIGGGLGTIVSQSQPAEVQQNIEQPDQPDLSRFGSQNRDEIEEVSMLFEEPVQPEAPAEPAASVESPTPTPVTPEQTISATILGQDQTELRQQEAIATGQPLPPVEEEVVTTEEAVEEPATEGAIPEATVAVEDDITAPESKATTPELPDPSALSFGDQVKLAAFTSQPEQRHGNRKAFISEVWKNWQDQTGQAIPLDEFKNRLLEEVRSGSVGLSRLDFAFPGSEVQTRAEESSLQYGREQFNFVEVPQEPPKGPVRAAEADSAQVDLPTVDPDTFERLSDEPIREGWVGYQDPETNQIFQVPEGSTPEVIQQRLQEVRAEESEAYRRSREEQLERELMQQRFDENVRQVMENLSREEAPILRKDLMSEAGPTPLWSDVDRLKFQLDRQEMNLKRAMAGTLKDPDGKRVNPEALRRGVEALRERYNELNSKVIDARDALKGMKKGNRGEQGSTTLPQAIVDLGASLYQRGAQFADWSASMVKNLGQQVQPFLQQIWDTVTVAINSLTPGARGQTQGSMRRAAPRPEGGAVGSAGGTRPPVSIANQNVAQSRIASGLEARVAPFRRAFGTVWEDAMQIVQQNPAYPASLVAELGAKPRATTDTEAAILLYERVVRENEYDAALDAANNAPTEADVQGAQERIRRAQQAQQQLFDVTEAVGTQTARGLAIRRMLANRDFTVEKMKAETRAIENKGKPLTPEQEKRIEDLYAKLKAAETRIKELEEQQSKEDAATTFKAMMKEIQSDRRVALKEGKGVTQFLNEQAEKARERMRAKLNQFGSAPDPTILVDAAIIGASHIANGIKATADLTARLANEFGDWIKPYLPDIVQQAQNLHDAEVEAFKQKSTQPSRAEGQETPQQVLARFGSQLDPKLVYELVRAYVRSGLRGLDEVMNAVHRDLSTKIPGVTIREIRDAYSGYGKVQHPSKEETKVALRELRTLARLTSQLEDVERRRAPLRTGLQRDKLTAEARILQKQINDLMKKYDIRTTSPEQQLKTSIEAVKTRLRNQIEELDLAIRNNEAIPTNRRTIQYDAETKALRDRRDQLRSRYNEIFQRPKESAQDRINSILKALDRSIAQETQMLREGILKRPPNAPQPTTPEIENKRMELDALRQLRRELYARTQPRKSAEDIALEQAIKAAKASIERMDQMFRSGNLTPAQRAQRFNPTDELEALWNERDAMRDALAELRRAQKPRKDKEETRRKTTIKALEKSIADLDMRLLSNDFSARPRVANRPETQRVSELREIRDQMRKTFEELKKAQTPQRSPQEIALERSKQVIRTRIKSLQAKLDAGDFTPPPKKDPAMDREKRQLQFDYQKLRETYLKGLFEAQLRNRPLAKKIFGTIGETLNTSRAILTSADFSGVLRQGGFIAFGNPARAAKALGPMFRAFRSEKGAFEVEQEIKSRPNYQDGVYQQAGLYLADDAPASLSKMEEAYMSRWANKIPLVAGSQRAYTTFLNKLRADSFDAMAATLAKNGTPTAEEAKAIANFVNVATGRGSLGAANSWGTGLNTIFFAPRYVISRFQILAGQPFYGGNARTRKLIAKEYAKYLAGVGIVTSLLAAFLGDDEERGSILGFRVPLEMDPRSSDFLKVRMGNTRLDPFSGLLQVTTLIERMRTAETKNNAGEIIPLSGDTVKYGGSSTTDVLVRFLRSKLSPAVGSALDRREGKNVVGDTVGTKEVIQRGLVPISFGEILETMQEQGVPRGTALSLLSMFGIGLQTYEPRESTPRRKSEADPYTSTPF